MDVGRERLVFRTRRFREKGARDEDRVCELDTHNSFDKVLSRSDNVWRVADVSRRANLSFTK